MLASFASSLGVDLETIREDLGEFVSTVRHDAQVAMDVVGGSARQTGSALFRDFKNGEELAEWSERLNEVEWEKELEGNLEIMCLDTEEMQRLNKQSFPATISSASPASLSHGTEKLAVEVEAAVVANSDPEAATNSEDGQKNRENEAVLLSTATPNVSRVVDTLFDVPLLDNDEVASLLAGGRGQIIPSLYLELVPGRVTHEDFVRRMNYHRARIIAETLEDLERESLRAEQETAQSEKPSTDSEALVESLRTRVAELEHQNTVLSTRNKELEELLASWVRAPSTSTIAAESPVLVEEKATETPTELHSKKEDAEEEEEEEEGEMVSAPSSHDLNAMKERPGIQPVKSPESTASAEGWESWE